MSSILAPPLFVGVSFSLVTAACLMESSDCALDGTCAAVTEDAGGPVGDAETDGDGGTTLEPPVPPGCDVGADAKDSLPCAVTSFALFVNANAPEAGDGSKEKPFRAIQPAIDAVPNSGKRRIYICGAATYAEHLRMKAADYARLLGGFDCATWSPSADKPKVAPSDAGYALHLEAIPSEVRIEDVAFETVAGTAASRSSIAVFVANSPNVLFKRADVKANRGADGVDGVVGKAGVPTPSNLDGLAASGITGGLAKTCTCDTGGSSVGGKGGNTNEPPIDGDKGLPAIDPPSPATSTGEGQTSAACNTDGVSAKGGSTGKTGAGATAPTRGTLEETGWLLGDGKSGEPGTPGQGGGGGGARTNGTAAQNGGGGGGGCGGCGGGGGTGGTAGGASIGIVSFASTVSVVSGRIETAAGGKGGAGKPGRAGAAGGGKGAGAGGGGCTGGGGGTGGTGGSGAGGAGGASVGILYSGPTPRVQDGTIFTRGAKGAGGLGGAPTVNDGPSGLEGDTVSAP